MWVVSLDIDVDLLIMIRNVKRMNELFHMCLIKIIEFYFLFFE
jgi:hypothetical protein